MKARAIAALKYLVGVLLGVALMALAFRGMSWQDLKAMMSEVHVGLLLLSLTVSGISHWLRGWRWVLLIEANDKKVSVINAFAAVMFGYMVNNAVPRLGEISRCTILMRSDRLPLVTSAGTVVTERVIDVLILLGLVGVVFLLELDRLLQLFTEVGAGNNWSWSLLLVPLGLLAAFAAAVYLLRHRWQKLPVAIRVRKLVIELWRSAMGVFRLKRPIMFWVQTFLVWFAYVLAIWLSMKALPATSDLGLYMALVLTAMGGIGMALPSPGGIGSFHTAVAYTFLAFSLDKEAGISLALLIHTPQLLQTTVLGAVSYFFLVFRSRNRPEEVKG